MDEEWTKVLYKCSPMNGGLPDNYTDTKFLEGLKHNLHFKPVTASTALVTATRVSTQISVTVIFWTVFLQLKNANAQWLVTYWVFSICTVLAYGFLDGFRHFHHVFKNALLFLAVGYACTPILKTLTDTISTDTIYAMSAILMLIHISFHGYGIDSSFVSPYLSLNAAVCGAICLASRLPETKHAFVLLTLAVQAFALFPELYEGLDYTLVGFILSFTSAVICLSIVSGMPPALMYIFIIFLVNVIFPLCFVWAQKYKDNIHGPWDEAMISSK